MCHCRSFIRVGAATETEMKDRIEDALRATRAAGEEGIVEKEPSLERARRPVIGPLTILECFDLVIGRCFKSI